MEALNKMEERNSRITNRQNNLVAVFFMLMFFSLFGCKKKQPANQEMVSNISGYEFHTPDLLVELPDVLQEISGIEVGKDFLYAIQDELGVLYKLDRNRPNVIRDESQIYIDGDYEAIAYDEAKASFYIMRSDAVLLHYRPFKKKKKLKKYLIPLDKVDIEAMAFGLKSEQLLFLDKEEGKKSLSVHSFDLEEKSYKGVIGKILLHNKEKLRPTSLVFDAHNQVYWMLTTKPNFLLQLDISFKEIGRTTLPEQFVQPEGVTVDENGVLYITTEGKDGPACLGVFKPKE